MQGCTGSVSWGSHANSRPHNLLLEWFSKLHCRINFSEYDPKGGFEMYKVIQNLIGLGKMFAHQM